jgi:cytoskeletal protein CcmA (bactofilin family)
MMNFISMLNRKEKTNFESTDSVNRLVEGTKIIGDIISESNIRIDGEIEGNITTSAKVVIGENGTLKGNLTCQEADIEGRIEGKLMVEGLLILRDRSNIQGDIYTNRLHIEEGAIFLGACKMNGAGSFKVNTSSGTEETENSLY